MSSLFFVGADRADPMPGKNERQGRNTNIFFFHEGSLQDTLNLLRTITDLVVLVTRLTVEELTDEQRVALVGQFMRLQGLDAAF